MRSLLIVLIIGIFISFAHAESLIITTYSAGSTVSNVNVTVRYLNHTPLASKKTDYNGLVNFSLPLGNYLINATKSGYISNSRIINLDSDKTEELDIGTWDSVEVSATEDIHNIFTRINNTVLISNLSDSTNKCRYESSLSLDITQNGHLIMEGCTLEMNGEFPNPTRIIKVEGILEVNNSNITRAVGSTNSYLFYTLNESTLSIQNSYISYVGYGDYYNYGRGLEISSDNLVFINNTLSRGYGITLLSNNLILKDINVRNMHNFNLRNYGYNNTIKDSNISGAILYDVVLYSGKLSLINTIHSDEYGEQGILYKYWYLKTKLTNNFGTPLSNVNVTIKNITDSIIYTGLTNVSGDIPIQELSEFISNGSLRTYQNNYTILTNKANYKDKLVIVDLNQNRNVSIPITLSSGGCGIKCILGSYRTHM